MRGMAAAADRRRAAATTTTTTRPTTSSDSEQILQRSVTGRMDTFLDGLGSDRVGQVSVSAVAEHGYAYYHGDRSVRCVWCGAYLLDWQTLESESVIRQIHNETCPRGPPIDEEEDPSSSQSLAAGSTGAPLSLEDQIEGLGGNAEIDLSKRSAVPASFLRQDNERMREQRQCKKCLRSPVETLFLPCRHLVACEACADQVDDCFVCDEKILGTVRIYMQ